MPSVLAGIVLFGSSFAPLFGLFGLLDSFGTGAPSLICYGIALAGALGLYVFMRSVRNMASITTSVASVTARDQDIIGYVVTYLLPFVALATATWRERAALIIFIVLVAVLYLQAGLLYVNPLLALARYRLFEADLGTGHSVIIITRRRYIAPGTSVELRTVSESLYVEAEGGSGERRRRRRSKDAA